MQILMRACILFAELIVVAVGVVGVISFFKKKRVLGWLKVMSSIWVGVLLQWWWKWRRMI